MNLVLPNVTEEQRVSLLSQLSGIAAPPPGPVLTPPGPVVDPLPGPIVIPGGGRIIAMEMPWSSSHRIFTKDAGGFGADDVVAVGFMTGNTPSTADLPRLAAAEWIDPLYNRIACISEVQGSFDAVPGMLSTSRGTSVQCPFTVVTPDVNGGLYPTLKANTKYWFNLKLAPGSGLPEGATANMFIDLYNKEH